MSSARPLKQIALYTVPGFVARGVGFVLLPLYARHLDMAEFGRYELLLTGALVLTFALQLGWQSAFLRLYADPENRSDPARGRILIRTLLMERIVVYVLTAVLLWSIGPSRIAATLLGRAETGPLLWLVLSLWMFQDLFGFFDAAYRSEGRAGRYAVCMASVSVLQLVGVSTLLLHFQMGVAAIFTGQAIAFAVVLIGTTLYDRRRLFRHLKGPWFDPAVFKRALSYGIPLVPAALAMMLVLAGDRWMLLWLAADVQTGEEQVAVYGMASRFVMLAMLAATGFQQFWGPYVFKHCRKRLAPIRFARLFADYSGALFAATMLICAVLPWVVDFVLGSYAAAVPLVPILLAGFVIYNIGDFFCVGISIREKTSIRAWAGAGVAVVNILLNLVLIPRLGPQGAALASMLSYAVYAACLMPASHRLYPVRYPWATWLFPIGWCALGWPASSLKTVSGNWALAAYSATGLLIYVPIYIHGRNSVKSKTYRPQAEADRSDTNREVRNAGLRTAA